MTRDWKCPGATVSQQNTPHWWANRPHPQVRAIIYLERLPPRAGLVSHHMRNGLLPSSNKDWFWTHRPQIGITIKQTTPCPRLLHHTGLDLIPVFPLFRSKLIFGSWRWHVFITFSVSDFNTNITTTSIPPSNWNIGTGEQTEPSSTLVLKFQQQMYFPLIYRMGGVGGGAIMEELEMKEGEWKTHEE